MPVIVTPVPQTRTAAPIAPVIPGAGSGMMTMVGSESVFDSLKWSEFWAEHKNKVYAGGAVLGGYLLYRWNKNKKKSKRRRKR